MVLAFLMNLDFAGSGATAGASTVGGTLLLMGVGRVVFLTLVGIAAATRLL